MQTSNDDGAMTSFANAQPLAGYASFSIEKLANTTALPTLPEVASEMLRLAELENPRPSEIARIIQMDPPVCNRMMRTVNSPMMGFRPRVESVEDAVVKLGLNMVRTFLLSFHLANNQSPHPDLAQITRKYWRCSLTQGVIAELLAKQLKIDPGKYFLAAMIQDIGSLAMMSEAPKLFLGRVMAFSRFPNVTAAEEAAFGFSHAEVSAKIVSNWGLPKNFSEAVLGHHDFDVATNDDLPMLCKITRAASMGASVLFAKQTELMARLELWQEFLNRNLNIGYEEMGQFIPDICDMVEEYAAIFQFEIADRPNAEKIAEKAKELLVEIALADQAQLASQENVSLKQAFQNELYRDPLSGLNNRRFLNEKLNDILAEEFYQSHSVGLFFIDVDRFKHINDTWGHSVGDQAIIHIAKWLQNSLRTSDISVRLGGDEFIVFLREITLGQLESIAERIATQIPALDLGQEQINISLSIGGIHYLPNQNDTADGNQLIELADHCMYEAKQNDSCHYVIRERNGLAN